jgi:hypothetical protein
MVLPHTKCGYSQLRLFFALPPGLALRQAAGASQALMGGSTVPVVMVAGSSAWPECEIIQALAYIHGNRPADNLRTSPCGGGPVKELEIRGSATHRSVSGTTDVGPVSKFNLCQHHRKEASIRAAKLTP